MIRKQQLLPKDGGRCGVSMAHHSAHVATLPAGIGCDGIATGGRLSVPRALGRHVRRCSLTPHLTNRPPPRDAAVRNWMFSVSASSSEVNQLGRTSLGMQARLALPFPAKFRCMTKLCSAADDVGIRWNALSRLKFSCCRRLSPASSPPPPPPVAFEMTLAQFYGYVQQFTPNSQHKTSTKKFNTGARAPQSPQSVTFLPVFSPTCRSAGR